MAAVNTNSVAAFVSGKGLIATTFEAFQRWNDVRCTRAVLSKLSDRELSDICLLYTSPSPRDYGESRMPSSA